MYQQCESRTEADKPQKSPYAQFHLQWRDRRNPVWCPKQPPPGYALLAGITLPSIGGISNGPKNARWRTVFFPLVATILVLIQEKAVSQQCASNAKSEHDEDKHHIDTIPAMNSVIDLT